MRINILETSSTIGRILETFPKISGLVETEIDTLLTSNDVISQETQNAVIKKIQSMDEMMDKYDRQLLSHIRSIARSKGTAQEDENTKVITARKRIKEYKDDVRRRVEDFKNLCLAHNMALGVFPVEPAAPAQPEVSPTTEKTV